MKASSLQSAVILSLFSLSFLCSVSADTAVPPTVTLPYETFKREGRETGFVLLSMRINKSLPVTMLLDTGATDAMISAAVVKKLGLTPKPALAPDGSPVLNMGQPATFVEIAALDAPKLNLHGTFIVNDNLSIFPGHPFDGVIGMEFLSEFGIIIDYPRHEITVTLPSALTKEGIASLGFAGATVIPITKGEMDCYYTTVPFRNGEKQAQERMMVDSGSNTTVVSAHLAYQLGLKPDKRQKYVATASGVSSLLFAPVPSFQLGGQSITNHIVSFPMLDMANETPRLGNDVWINDRVLFDFSGGKMYLQDALTPSVLGDRPDPSEKPKT